ncbi:hypothetical protein C8Q76DRAFT_688977 [Earliella scabrosa]|nr:hypothetical protein C8Q76DRAFT_688977 [Earliella scabrosa]
MPPRRDYFRPGEPGARPITPREVTGVPRKSYSSALKVACRKGSATRVPPWPSHCPQCHMTTSYLAQLCYMEGVAGAYVFIGKKCSHRHWPVQTGPSDSQLEEIEEERERDPAGTPRRTPTQKGKAVLIVGQPRVRAHEVGSRSRRPSGRHNAPAQLGDGSPAALKTVSNDRRLTQNSDGAPANISGENRPSYEHRRDCKGPYFVHVVVWHQAKRTPEGRLCEVDGYCDEHVLYIAQIPWIYTLGNDFDYWSYDLCDWVELDRPCQAIHLETNFDVCLLRVRGVVCHRFGSTLSSAEGSQRAKTSRVPLAEAVGEPMTGSLWALLWTEDHAGPEVFCFPIPPSDVLFIVETEAYAQRLTGLEGSRLLEFWHEGRADWGRVDMTVPLHVDPHAPLILLRRPDAFALQGLGEAIEYLADQRIDDNRAPVYPRPATSAEMRYHRVQLITRPASESSGPPGLFQVVLVVSTTNARVELEKIVPISWIAARATPPEEWQQFRSKLDEQGIRPELSQTQQDSLEVFTRLLEFFSVSQGLQAVSLWCEFCDRVLDMAALSKGRDVSEWLGRFVPWAQNITELHLSQEMVARWPATVSWSDMLPAREDGAGRGVGRVEAELPGPTGGLLYPSDISETEDNE